MKNTKAIFQVGNNDGVHEDDEKVAYVFTNYTRNERPNRFGSCVVSFFAFTRAMGVGAALLYFIQHVLSAHMKSSKFEFFVRK